MPVNREIYTYPNTLDNLRDSLEPNQRGITIDGYPSGGLSGLWVWKDNDSKLNIGARQVRWHNNAWQRLNNVFGNLDILNLKTTGLSDDFVTTPVPVGEDGATALSGSFNAVSIIGALNELIGGVDPLWNIDDLRVYPTNGDYVDVLAGITGENVDGYIPIGEAGNTQLNTSFTATSIIGALNELIGGSSSKWVEVDEVLKPAVEEQVQIGSEDALGVFTAKDGSVESPSGNLIVTNASGDMAWESLDGIYEPVAGRDWSYKKQGFSTWINQGSGDYESIWVITKNADQRFYWEDAVSHYSLYGATGIWLKTNDADIREPVTEWSTSSADYRPSFFGYGDIVSTSMLRGKSLEVGGSLIIDTDEFEDIHFKRLNDIIFSILENGLVVQRNHLQVGGNVSEWGDNLIGYQADEMNLICNNLADTNYYTYNLYPTTATIPKKFKAIADGLKASVLTQGLGSLSYLVSKNTLDSGEEISIDADVWDSFFSAQKNRFTVPRLRLLSDEETSGVDGDVRYSGSDVLARIGGSWVSLTTTVIPDRSALSVMGRPSDTAGAVSDIVAGTNYQTLMRWGSTLAFRLISGVNIEDDAIINQKIADGAVTNIKLSLRNPLSVMGNASNVNDVTTDIIANTDHHVLRRSGSSLGFGLIVNNNITDGTIALNKMANINGQRLLGKATSGSGAVSEISLGDGLVFDGTTLKATGSGSTKQQYTWIFARQGDNLGQVVVEATGLTNTLGFRVPKDVTVTSISFATNTSSVNQASTCTVQVRRMSQASGSQFTVGGGTFVGSTTLTSNGALSVLYYRGSEADLSADVDSGQVLFVQLQPEHWVIKDIIVTVTAIER